MFSSLFLSKNEKIVKAWKIEHKEIGELTGKIIDSYDNKNLDETKKHLKSLKYLIVEHLMQEDLAFYNLLKNSKNLDSTTVEHIRDFRETFKGTKTALMNFISKYALEETKLDNNFLISFKGLVRLVVERINYEENNLYHILAKEK